MYIIWKFRLSWLLSSLSYQSSNAFIVRFFPLIQYTMMFLLFFCSSHFLTQISKSLFNGERFIESRVGIRSIQSVKDILMIIDSIMDSGRMSIITFRDQSMHFLEWTFNTGCYVSFCRTMICWRKFRVAYAKGDLLSSEFNKIAIETLQSIVTAHKKKQN